MTGICSKLTLSWNSNINSSIIYRRCTGRHCLCISLCICNYYGLFICDFSGLPVNLCIAKDTTFTGEEHSVRFWIMRNIGTDISADAIPGIYHFSGFPVKYQQACTFCAVSAGSVIGAYHSKFIRYISASPVKSSCTLVSPGSNLFFCSLRRVFISHTDTYKISIFCLTVPETCIDITIFVSNRTVRLTFQIILINPKWS